MIQKTTLRTGLGLFLFLFLFSAQRVYACHGISLISPSVSAGPSSVTINASSDPASCGCGPYYMEVELSMTPAGFTGAPPVYTSPSWGTAPWYHSLLNIAGYGPPNWLDNCAMEAYTTIVIPYSSLCSGSTFYLRMREHVVGSSSTGPWTTATSFTTPGTPPTASVTATAAAFTICSGDSVLLTSTGTGCIGGYDYSWSPAASLTNPTSAVTAATPTVTTTYTVTFTDYGLNQTATATVTINVNSNPTSSLSTMIESGCNASSGTAMVSTTGGSAPYAYNWTPSGGTGATATGLPSGTYTVMTTDANGCMQFLTVVVGDSCDFVWPGDANDDAVADMIDILDIAIANGATGTTRAGATLTWIGQPSANWGTTLLSGTDYKFVDCNGDGTIDLNDTNAVIVNYGFTHNNRMGEFLAGGAPVLEVDLAVDSLLPGTPGVARILLGDQSQQANTIYGIAFTLSFDPMQVDPMSMSLDLSSSWLGTAGVNLTGVRYTQSGWGMVDVVITRYDHMDNNGMGEIGRLHFMTTNTLTGTGNSQNVPLTISNVRMVDATGAILPLSFIVNDTLTVFDVMTGIVSSTEISALTVTPNPGHGQFTLQYNVASSGVYITEVMNVLGEVVYSEQFNAQQGEQLKAIDISAMGSGVYLVRVSGAGGAAVERVMVR